ncbi:MAG: 3-oxoacyl-ACP reductase FabG [Gammaproteobacteria bacterium]|nr:3-oxoacyl-ACP reductase FabG [Gammaproteobacteria bacterium]
MNPSTSTSAARIALVTGASRGIGAAIADALAAQGHQVFGTATSAAGASAISARLAALNPQLDAAGLQLDVNDSDSIAQALAVISERAGAPTILVNNAGITRDQLLLRMSEDDWQSVQNTDLRSVFRLSKACLRGMMKQRWGRIISITSVIGSIGNPGQANYAAAKAGVTAFSKSLAREVGSRGITVNVVAPGFIETDMTADLDAQQRDAMLANIPLARLGQVEDIAHAVSFLASEQAAYISGETLHVNGGMYMA